MATKKFRGLPCIYCDDGISTREGDHVIARELLPVVRRDRMPKVPCCVACNNTKAALEHYLATVLPFGARHEDASELMEELPRRLAKNQRLARKLRDDRTPALDASGLVPRLHLTRAVPFEGERLEALSTYIARGLLFHHWRIRLAVGDIARAMCVTEAGDELLRETLLRMGGERVVSSLAGNALRYEALKATAPPTLSIWRLQFLGGAVSIEADGTRSTTSWVFTGRGQLVDRLVDLLQ